MAIFVKKKTWLYLIENITHIDGRQFDTLSPFNQFEKEDQIDPCEQLDTLSPFNPLSEMRPKKRKENP